MKDKKTEAERIILQTLQRESDGEKFLGIRLGAEEIVVDVDTALDIFDKIGDFLETCGYFDDEVEAAPCILH